MARPLVALLALLLSAPAGAQGPLNPAGRLPPVNPPARDDPGRPPRTATPVEPPTQPLPRGAVLEQISGVVREVDRKSHHITLESNGERVTLALDRNTMVYTSAGLGTVLDVTPGASIRAGRNADFVAYWVQVRPIAGKGTPTAAPTPGQGTGPGGGAAAPAGEPRGGGAGGGGTPTPAPAGPGAGTPPAGSGR